MKLNFLCFKEHNLLRAAPCDRSCLEGKGWRLFFITVLCRDHYFAFYFISCSPVGGKVTGQTNVDADSLIHHGLTSAPHHWLTCACNQPSRAAHLKGTLHTWTVLTIFSSLNWFKASFYSGTLSVVSEAPGMFSLSDTVLWIYIHIYF